MLNLRNIKNIIFDLGGVILNIEPQLMQDEFRKIGNNNFDTAFFKFQQENIFNRFELGEISPEDFREKIQSGLGISITTKQFDQIWNKLLLDFPDERINLIQKLKPRYKLFLLSNTNRIHFDSYCKTYRDMYVFNFSALFLKTYYSFMLKLKKPDERIFKLILEENNLIPEETLFIDDTQEHVLAAEKLGFVTHWLKPGETINTIGLL